jgi:hypothetical protein
MGRPSIFTQKIADRICIELADGKSLREICEADDMPARSSVYLWLIEHEVFSDQYRRARELQAETGVDEIIEIADDGRNDWMERHVGDDVRWVENGEAIRRSQLRIHTRQWKAERLRPKVYGPKSALEMSGPNGGPIQTEGVVDLTKLSEEQLIHLAELAKIAGGNSQGN